MGDGDDGLLPTDGRPGSEDLDRWRRRQRQFNEIHEYGTMALSRDDEHRVVVLTTELARLMWEFYDDTVLWRSLRRDQVDLTEMSEQDHIRLLAMTRIEWSTFLTPAAHGPPASKLSDELRIDLQRAIDNPGAVDIGDLRRRVKEMAVRLDRALADSRPGALGRMWGKVRQALPGAGRAGVVNGVAGAAGSAAGAALGPFAGKAAKVAATRGLDRALPKTKVLPPRRAVKWEVRELVHDELGPEHVGHELADAGKLLCLPTGRHASLLSAAVDAGLETTFASVLTWVDRRIAVLFVIWDRLESDGRVELEGHLSNAIDRLIRIRSALADFGVVAASFDELLQNLVSDLDAIYDNLAWY